MVVKEVFSVIFSFGLVTIIILLNGLILTAILQIFFPKVNMLYTFTIFYLITSIYLWMRSSFLEWAILSGITLAALLISFAFWLHQKLQRKVIDKQKL